jgi:hypothetical protein
MIFANSTMLLEAKPPITGITKKHMKMIPIGSIFRKFVLIITLGCVSAVPMQAMLCSQATAKWAACQRTAESRMERNVALALIVCASAGTVSGGIACGLAMAGAYFAYSDALDDCSAQYAIDSAGCTY